MTDNNVKASQVLTVLGLTMTAVILAICTAAIL